MAKKALFERIKDVYDKANDRAIRRHNARRDIEDQAGYAKNLTDNLHWLGSYNKNKIPEAKKAEQEAINLKNRLKDKMNDKRGEVPEAALGAIGAGAGAALGLKCALGGCKDD